MKPVRRGFTLVEILVVIAIIGVLVALLLPAVQSARMQTRCLQCQCQLSQLILAVQNYETLHGVYPPGTIDAKGPILNAQLGYHHNWIIQILPYIEQTNTWEAIDKRVGVYHARQVPLLAAAPRILDCPGCPAPQGNPCYAGVHHDVEKPIDATDNGMFFLNSKLRIEDVQDGLSQTLSLGEKMPDGWDLHWMSGTRATLRNAGWGINAHKYRVDLPAADDRTSGEISAWELSAMIPGEGPLDAPPPPAGTEAEFPQWRLAPPTSPGGPGNPLWVGGFGSDHRSGANFAFGDGSVRLLANTLQPIVLQQLAHRKDGNVSPRP
jgi:prepilin-type N-terminal cleavage/methylation domain-containing protein/prepilin-type processing-associated H-X9-DG protein